jgi:hypothetical protein
VSERKRERTRVQGSGDQSGGGGGGGSRRRRARGGGGGGGGDTPKGGGQQGGDGPRAGKPSGGGGTKQGGGGGNKRGRKGGRKRSQNNRRGKNRRPDVLHDAPRFWGDASLLPEASQDVRITDDPSAVSRSLGPPPLPGHEVIAEQYFGVVYDRAVTTAGLLAAAGGLIDAEDLVDEDD